MKLRHDVLRAMAQSFHAEPLDELHPEDRRTVFAAAIMMLDAALELLADRADELSAAAIARHPFGKGPVSTPKTVIEHAVAALRETP